MIRRTLLALTVAAMAAVPALAAEAAHDYDVVLGDPKAKVTVTEYASITCIHCANFHADVWPAFKKKYVDTGKVRFVFKEFPTAPGNVAFAGFMTARCAGPARYFQVIDALFKTQSAFAANGDAKAFVFGAGAAGGLDEAAVMACLGNNAALEALQARVDDAIKVAKIEGTPTFVIGDKPVINPESLAPLEAVIEPLLKARR